MEPGGSDVTCVEGISTVNVGFSVYQGTVKVGDAATLEASGCFADHPGNMCVTVGAKGNIMVKRKMHGLAVGTAAENACVKCFNACQYPLPYR